MQQRGETVNHAFPSTTHDSST